MNFNKINKDFIEKEEINKCIKKDKNWEKASVYFYKIACIVANKFKFQYSSREEFIQDAVCTAYIRRKSFDRRRNKCAYSYFYKVILNHYKDILRKILRRNTIAPMVSYEKAVEDNIYFKKDETTGSPFRISI